MPKMHFTLNEGDSVDPYAVMINPDLGIGNTPAHYIRIQNNDPDHAIRIGLLPALEGDANLNPTGGLIEQLNDDVHPPFSENTNIGQRYGFCGDAGGPCSDVWVIIVTGD